MIMPFNPIQVEKPYIPLEPKVRLTSNQAVNLSLSVTVTLKKKLAFYVPRFNSDGPRKSAVSHFQIAKFWDEWFSSSGSDFLFGSRTYNFKGRGLCFWILALFIQDKIPVLKKWWKYPPIAIYKWGADLPPPTWLRILRPPPGEG